MQKLIALLFLASFSMACTKQPDLQGFDALAFKADKGACQSQRVKQIAWLQLHRANFKGVSSNDLEDILGKPDIQQLADRNQEYYVYFLEPGPQCQSKGQVATAYTIAFRFSAIGLATEITMQAGLP